jgi:protein-disulfide isomerase
MNLLAPPGRPTPATTRREALALFGAGSLALAASARPHSALADTDGDNVLTEAQVLHDPDIPVAGNPKGDITIVEYFDYECPYCKKLEPELRQVVFDDGKVRLIWKDWPILGPMSIVATKLVLASRYQNKFIQAHDGLMALNARLTESRINEVLAGAGVDMDRLKRDLAANEAPIKAVVMRNNDQATAFGFKGTPSFIVGKFRVPGILTMEEFGQVIADARKAAAARK